jgi:hypothetical protein
VYVGNVPFHAGESTCCPSCGKVLIKWVGYNVDASGLRSGACRGCGQKIPGVWSQEDALAFKPREKAEKVSGTLRLKVPDTFSDA